MNLKKLHHEGAKAQRTAAKKNHSGDFLCASSAPSHLCGDVPGFAG